jgi:hypothetical protein
MPASTLGVGIVGVSPVRGWAATTHILALRALPSYEIRALSAHNADSARPAGELFGVGAQGAPTVFGLQARQARAIEFVLELLRGGYVGEVLSTTMVGLSVPGNVVGQPNA